MTGSYIIMLLLLGFTNEQMVAQVIENKRTLRSGDDIVISCDFEPGMCGFTDDSRGEFTWLRHNGNTDTDNTGPSTDHTKGNAIGYYMYVESSPPRETGNIARLLSPIIHATVPRDLHFFYHMYGKDIGTLNVYIIDLAGTERKVWSITGDQGDKWQEVKLDLPGGNYKVVFEGIRGVGFEGDIAIDDVVISPKVKTISACNFENGMCGNTQDTDDDFNWQRSHGQTV
ncbi:unnamed protein product, partial [Owenia fusiformis]